MLKLYGLVDFAVPATSAIISPKIPVPATPGVLPSAEKSDQGTYIVQLSSGSTIGKRSTKSLFHERAALALDYYVRKEFDLSLF